jgi:hypothetical protein
MHVPENDPALNAWALSQINRARPQWRSDQVRTPLYTAHLLAPDPYLEDVTLIDLFVDTLKVTGIYALCRKLRARYVVRIGGRA